MGFGAVATVLLLSGVAAGPVGAHPEGPAHHAPLPAHATAVMKAFARDAQAASTTASTGSAACADLTTDSRTQQYAAGYPCEHVDLEAFVALADMGGLGKANDVWGWTSGTRHFALVGRVFGTSFVEVTDPANPVYLGYLPTHGAVGSSWRDIKVDGNHAFIVSEATNHGMQVFDLTRLLGVSGGPVKFGETAHYSKISSAHNIAINEASDRAYIVGAAGRNGCKGGLHIVDISTPTKPLMVGCYSGDGYTHDTQCVAYTGPDESHRGREICFSSNEDTLTIVDVTGRPRQLSRTGYTGSAYTHQGWLTEDQKYFLIDDEMDERNNGHGTRTWVFDVTDLDKPILTSYRHFESTSAAIDHNQYVVGGFSFQANYRSGLRILDARTPATGLTQVGYFDIYPTDDAPEFNGAWSVYPYFTDTSGRFVVVSGIEQGLFVLRPKNLS